MGVVGDGERLDQRGGVRRESVRHRGRGLDQVEGSRLLEPPGECQCPGTAAAAEERVRFDDRVRLDRELVDELEERAQGLLAHLLRTEHEAAADGADALGEHECLGQCAVVEREGQRRDVRPALFAQCQQPNRLREVSPAHMGVGSDHLLLVQAETPRLEGVVGALQPDEHDPHALGAQVHRRAQSGLRAGDLVVDGRLDAPLLERVGRVHLADVSDVGGAQIVGDAQPLGAQVEDRDGRGRPGSGEGEERADAACSQNHRLVLPRQPAAAHGVHDDRHRLRQRCGVRGQPGPLHVDADRRGHRDQVEQQSARTANRVGDGLAASSERWQLIDT